MGKNTVAKGLLTPESPKILTPSNWPMDPMRSTPILRAYNAFDFEIVLMQVNEKSVSMKGWI